MKALTLWEWMIFKISQRAPIWPPVSSKGRVRRELVQVVSWIQVFDQLIKFWLSKQKAGRRYVIITLHGGAEGYPLAIHYEKRSASYIDPQGLGVIACKYNEATFWERVYGFEEILP